MYNTTRATTQKQKTLEQIVYAFYSKPLTKIILDYKGTKQEYSSITQLESEIYLWGTQDLLATFSCVNQILTITI